MKIALPALLSMIGLAACSGQTAKMESISGEFADRLTTSDTLSTFTALPGSNYDLGTPTPEIAGTDGDLNTAIYCKADCSFRLGFANSRLSNGAGTDFMILEDGIDKGETISVSVNGMTIVIDTFDYSAGLEDAAGIPIGTAALDLTTFGVAEGASVSEMTIRLDNRGDEFSSADFVDVAILN